MLIISLVCSLLMLVCVNVWVWRSQRVESAARYTWLFLLPGLCPLFAVLPTYLLNVLLVGVVGILCTVFEARRRTFVRASLLATLVSYGVGSCCAFQHVWELADLFPYESEEGRLNYEDRRDQLPGRLGLTSTGATGSSFREDRLAEIDAFIEREEEFHPYYGMGGHLYRSTLEEFHEHQLRLFVRAPSFGIVRFWFGPSYGLPQSTIPMSSLISSSSGAFRDNDPPDTAQRKPTAEMGWELHRESMADFLWPARFGYAKDRRHVAGFQSHQFNPSPDSREDKRTPKGYEMRRLELVSLLKHEQPGVYITENLPRMDLLRDVPIRLLDDFERAGLRRLWRGDDLVVDQQGNRLRMLGAIRAGKQCLSCHDAQRGDLLGAFSYHLVAIR